jgi:hypothetical protein
MVRSSICQYASWHVVICATREGWVGHNIIRYPKLLVADIAANVNIAWVTRALNNRGPWLWKGSASLTFYIDDDCIILNMHNE